MLDRIALPLALAALLCGCGQDLNAGGGTELPGPIRFYVISETQTDPANPGAARIAARQWRLWGVQARAADSTTLESRGLLSDSSGIVTLPPDSGTYLVEAWTTTEPPDSVDIRLKLANADLPDASSCLSVLHAGATPNSLKGCTQTRSSSPSAISGLGSTKLPDVLTMVRIPGNPSHQFRILGPVGDTLPLGEVRLWKWTGAPNQPRNDSLIFRGVLKQTTSVTSELPTLTGNDSFVMEGWRTPGVGAVRISTSTRMSIPQSDSLAYCKTAYTDPLPSILTLHQCRLGIANPSGGDIAPDFSAVMEYVPGN